MSENIFLISKNESFIPDIQTNYFGYPGLLFIWKKTG